MFGWRDWIFALKTFAAAIAALYIAMWLDLPRPYWALTTVYITSQVLVGATLSKALFRVLGTMLGAAASVAIVPNLVNTPELLIGAMALWVAVCLYVSLLSRTSTSYMPMLAGYTAALVGFPEVDAPGSIFDAALARTEEISIGILCAAVFSSVIFPQSVRPVLAARLGAWATDARNWIVGVLGNTLSFAESHADRLRLAARAVALDALITPLEHEDTTGKEQRRALMLLRQHMLMFLPIVSTISDRVTNLERAHALPDSMRKLLQDIKDWTNSDNDDPNAVATLHKAISEADPAGVKIPDAKVLACRTLAARLSDYVDLRQDFLMLRRAVATGEPPAEELAFRYSTQARTVRHRDHTMAGLSAVSTFIAIVAVNVFWIAVSWPDGSSAAMMAAVAMCFFATQDDPAPHMITFANAGIVGIIGAAIYLFALLPRATSFETLALALAPGLILCGIAMTQPKWAMWGIGGSVVGASTIAIQNSYQANFATFANGAISFVVGIWIAVIVTRLTRTVETAWSARRLRRINRLELVRAAQKKEAQDSLKLAALMLDRVGLIATRLDALPPEDSEDTAALLTDVRIGINIVELRRIDHDQPRPIHRALGRVLDGVAQHFSTTRQTPSQELLASIDETLDLIASFEDRDLRTAQVGLYGLRRGLFPDAQPYKPMVQHLKETA
ncbi:MULTISPECIES: FUSC family protein [unclassified Hyphomicrobium]|uniref:FUSC family protein n=1 Tax=unclassified Hyphomicrobium TaxID=2619925 RepID=UPI000213DDAA|nr:MULTISPECIES: FUSC family protein [unclassified Hyphomicrobium]CCB67608.1 putative efflux transporter permease, aromatic acid exporter family [Hyphomicrobium sp. MC1]